MIVVEFLLGGLALLAAWQVRVRFFPWKDCPRCDGGKRIESGRVHRDCGRCGATGRVRRWGAPRQERL